MIDATPLQGRLPFAAGSFGNVVFSPLERLTALDRHLLRRLAQATRKSKDGGVTIWDLGDTPRAQWRIDRFCDLGLLVKTKPVNRRNGWPVYRLTSVGLAEAGGWIAI